MEIQPLIPAVALILGAMVGATCVWLVFRSKAIHFREIARGERAAEFAKLEERIESKTSEVEALRKAIEKELSERARLIQDLRAETDQRSAAEQRASRI